MFKGIEKRYLQKGAKELFLLFFLSIPYIVWLYSIGIELNKKISKEDRINPKFFKLLLGYVLVYFPIGIFMILFSNNESFEKIIPFHIIAMVCVFVTIILTTITILRFERHNGFPSSSGIGIFFGIWYYIFGVWSIQPKLNKYVDHLNVSLY